MVACPTGEFKEGLFQSQATRFQFQQIPTGMNDGAGHVGTGVFALQALHLKYKSPGARQRRDQAPCSRRELVPTSDALPVRRHLRCFHLHLNAPNPARFFKFSTESVTTSLPLLMIMTFLQTASTSGRMCVLRMMVCSPDRLLINSRVSLNLFRIQARRGFVENQDIGIMNDRLRQTDALPVALR